MKKLILLTPTMHAASVAAEWTLFSGDDARRDEFYLDYDTLKPTAHGARIRMLNDHHKPDPDGSRSIRLRSVYDCEVNSQRILQMCVYAKPTSAPSRHSAQSSAGDDPADDNHP